MAASMKFLEHLTLSNIFRCNFHYFREFGKNPVLCCTHRHFTGTGIPAKPDSTQLDKDGFRIYRIPGFHQTVKAKQTAFRTSYEPVPPREKKMPVDQDWTNVWPTAATFKPSVVPLPIRQGYVQNSGENGGVSPDKYYNFELMKITNFLHLTPRHISKHCSAIKKFCTPWPTNLDEKKCRKHFPVSIVTQDYLYAGPSLRDPRSRKVTLKFRLDALELDSHAKDKIIRLLGHRYDKKTGEATLQTDRCPSRLQNTDYVKYLLTAIYFESWKTEPWESEMTWADLKTYEWDKSKCKEKIERFIGKLPHAQTEEWKQHHLNKYKDAVTRLHNDEENPKTLAQYKKVVLNMLRLRTKSQLIEE